MRIIPVLQLLLQVELVLLVLLLPSVVMFLTADSVADDDEKSDVVTKLKTTLTMRAA
jgi:hypothetical protein